VHDPTTLDRQGADEGTQYASAIFTETEDQAATARALIAEIEAEKVFPRPIVTAVRPLTKFYEAEEYHQRFFERNPNQPYCAAVVAPKVAKFRKAYMDRLIRHDGA
jgi:peptide-methionine (S)-S-oxide reductase